MKYIFLIALFLLSSCGGGEQSYSPRLLASSTLAVSVDSPTIVLGERRSYDISATSAGVSGKSKVAALGDFHARTLTLRLQDISLSFDTEGMDGQLYRLYQASFGRVPDVAGYGYWRDAITTRGLSLNQVADSFLSSNESKALFGSNSDDASFTGKVYQNVLGRIADPAGASYWTDVLKKGALRRDVLLAFADSPENKNATANGMKNGMAFAEPGISYIPVSNATGPTDVPIGLAFTVDGTSSTDANGDSLTYSWSISTRPVGSIATIANPNMGKAQITPDLPGTYQLTLWVNDVSSRSYSPAQLTVNAHSLISDTGTYTCLTLDSKTANALYANGHTYLDRNHDGTPCNESDIAYEKAPPVAIIADTGRYKCTDITHAQAVLLYLQGHTYLDRDHDGKPCEATDITVEHTLYPPTPTTPNAGMCWVNGYTRKNGTHVSGYWRRC